MEHAFLMMVFLDLRIKFFDKRIEDDLVRNLTYYIEDTKKVFIGIDFVDYKENRYLIVKILRLLRKHGKLQQENMVIIVII